MRHVLDLLVAGLDERVGQVRGNGIVYKTTYAFGRAQSLEKCGGHVKLLWVLRFFSSFHADQTYSPLEEHVEALQTFFIDNGSPQKGQTGVQKRGHLQIAGLLLAYCKDVAGTLPA